MKLIHIIQNVLKDQAKRFRKMAVDIKIANGNILLRSFHIYDIDMSSHLVKGLTAQEEYAYAREGRNPVFCFLKFDEIKELVVPELGLEYHDEMAMVNL